MQRTAAAGHIISGNRPIKTSKRNLKLIFVIQPIIIPISYTDTIPADELTKYKVIPDWDVYLEDRLTNKSKHRFIQIDLHEHIIESDVEFFESIDYPLSFGYCYFKGNIRFHGTACKFPIQFNECRIDGTLSFSEDCRYEKPFDIHDTYVKYVGVMNGSFDKCIWEFQDITHLDLDGGQFKKLSVRLANASLDILSLNNQFEKLEGHIEIDGGDCRVDQLLIGGHLGDVFLSLKSLSVNVCVINEVTNEGILKLADIMAGPDPGSLFLISESYMGKTEFSQVDFSGFYLVAFHRSQLVDCSFVNVFWPKKISSLRVNPWLFLLDADIPKRKEHADKFISHRCDLEQSARHRETYRQLKYATAKQGDIVNEQAFHSLEMKAYNQSISWKNHFWTKTILLFSHQTSNFGQSVIRPLCWLGIVHFLLFAILVVGHHFPNLRFSFQHATFKGFIIGANYYFETINPFRKTESGQGFVVIDLLMRIWASYMIYNFIRASRRFIK